MMTMCALKNVRSAATMCTPLQRTWALCMNVNTSGNTLNISCSYALKGQLCHAAKAAGERGYGCPLEDPRGSGGSARRDVRVATQDDPAVRIVVEGAFPPGPPNVAVAAECTVTQCPSNSSWSPPLALYLPRLVSLVGLPMNALV